MTILNEEETIIKPINKELKCNNCKELTIENSEIDYLVFEQIGEYLTPSHRVKELVCDNCFDEYYGDI